MKKAHVVLGMMQSDGNNEFISRINNSIFAGFDNFSYGIKKIPAEEFDAERMKQIFQHAVKMLQKQFEKNSSFTLSDPDMIELLPFWQKLFQHLEVQDSYIIVLHQPLAFARSYQQLTGCELELGLLIWLSHMMRAIEETQGSERIVIHYDTPLAQPAEQLNRLRIFGDLDSIGSLGMHVVNASGVTQFKTERDDLKTSYVTAVVPLCVNVYDCLLKLSRDELRFDQAQFAAVWQTINSAYHEMYPMYCYLERLLNKRKLLQEKLRLTRKSILWKLILPLRYLDNLLRDRRRQARIKKRAITANV